jgi:hypothetical protein
MPIPPPTWDNDALRAEIITFLTTHYIPVILVRGNIDSCFRFPVHLAGESPAMPAMSFETKEQMVKVFDSVAATGAVPATNITAIDLRIDLHGPNTAAATVLWRFDDASGKETFREVGNYFLMRFADGWRVVGAGRVMADPAVGDNVEAALESGGASRDPKWVRAKV